MSPKHTYYLLALENCGWKALFYLFKSLNDADMFDWAASFDFSSGAEIGLCWPSSDAACLQNQHFCLSCHSKDEEDIADSLSSPISIAVAL